MLCSRPPVAAGQTGPTQWPANSRTCASSGPRPRRCSLRLPLCSSSRTWTRLATKMGSSPSTPTVRGTGANPYSHTSCKKKNTQKVHVVLFLHTLCLPHHALSRVQGGDGVRLCMSVNSCLCGAAWWSEWPSDRPTQDSHVHFFFSDFFLTLSRPGGRNWCLLFVCLFVAWPWLTFVALGCWQPLWVVFDDHNVARRFRVLPDLSTFLFLFFFCSHIFRRVVVTNYKYCLHTHGSVGSFPSYSAFFFSSSSFSASLSTG